MKRRIINILVEERDASVRFEVLERFLDFIDSEEDVVFLIELLANDLDSCVRHKAAAQLFRIKEKGIVVTADLESKIIEALVDRAFHDASTVVRHESIEALGYLGNESTLDSLRELIEVDNPDVSATAYIAYETAKRRAEYNIDATELGDFLIRTSNS